MYNLPRKQRVKDASIRYGVSRSTMWRYIQQGLISSTKVSSRVTVLDTEELERFFNGK